MLREEVKRLDRIDYGLLGTLFTGFLTFCYTWFSFTLDDAYITLRYSKHLAEGHGLVWNPGTQNAVEGFTSLSWAVIGAIPHALNLPPVNTLKIFSIACGLTTIALIYLYGKKRNIDRVWSFILATPLAFSPAFAFLTIQGMETTFATLLVTASTISCLEYIRTNKKKYLISTSLFLCLGMLTRPGVALFAIGVMAGIAAVKYYRNGLKSIYTPFKYGTLFLLIPGAAYILFNLLYYGYPVPNPLYIKSSGGIVSIPGIKQTMFFLAYLVLPYAALGTFSLIFKSEEKIRQLFVNSLPILLASSIFIAIWFFFKPIQGFLYRFQMPLLPTLLILFTQANLELETKINRENVLKITLIIGLTLCLALYPMHTIFDADQAWDKRSQVDRVKTGQALNEFSNENYTMLVSESGALPYYSEWRAYDTLGLNSEYVAHKGLDQKFLERISPELIIFLAREESKLSKESPEVMKFMRKNNYALIAVVKKQRTQESKHFYFIKERLVDTALYSKLRNMDVDYENISKSSK
jgi:arabinofuranosyltransferase